MKTDPHMQALCLEIQDRDRVGRFCVFGGDGKCRMCGRHRNPAPAIGIPPVGTRKGRLWIRV